MARCGVGFDDKRLSGEVKDNFRLDLFDQFEEGIDLRHIEPGNRLSQMAGLVFSNRLIGDGSSTTLRERQHRDRQVYPLPCALEATVASQ